jgi:GNAT superfamily N-acetyltransferase
MFQVEERPRPWAEFAAVPSPAGPSMDAMAGARPDLCLLVRDGEGRAQARCSLWVDSTPLLDGQRTALIGHYAATDRGAAARLLEEAAARAAAAGAHLGPVRALIGPMDGNTWRAYRLVTDGFGAPPFLLEPVTPPEWADDFEAAGFEPLARYHSALEDPIRADGSPAALAEQHLRTLGLQVVPMPLDQPEATLQFIWRLSLEAFAGNFLYTPISWEEFLALYRPVLPLIDPRLLLLCTDSQGTPAGFLFALPDLLRSEPDTVIVKTFAVLPGLQGKGVGSALAELVRDAARRAGYRRMIHALFHVENRSGRISAHTGKPLREYTLFLRRLEPAT